MDMDEELTERIKEVEQQLANDSSKEEQEEYYSLVSELDSILSIKTTGAIPRSIQS